MRLRPVFSSAFLRLAADGGFACGSRSEPQPLPYSINSALPVIEEQYIRCQTDGGATPSCSTELQCSASDPCPDGSHCNFRGQYDYRDLEAAYDVSSKDSSQTCSQDPCCPEFGLCSASEIICCNLTAFGESLPYEKGLDICFTVSHEADPASGKGSGTASRWAAYYECWNACSQPCDKALPTQIGTDGVMQVVFSFATISPATPAVGPIHPDDEKLYLDFLVLKYGSQKWIGIGGWDVSDAGSTHQTWSLITESKANRSAFISSLLCFLQKWNFARVDINWEWHGADTLGGEALGEKENLAVLVKELRAALGSCDLSVVLPAYTDYSPCTDGSHVEFRASQQSFAASSSPAPEVLIIPMVLSKPAILAESVAFSAASKVSLSSAESLKPTASSATPGLSAQHPVPLLSWEPLPSVLMTLARLTASSKPTEPKLAAFLPASTQPLLAASLKPLSASLATSKTEASTASSAVSPASTSNAASQNFSSGSSSLAPSTSSVSSAPAASAESVLIYVNSTVSLGLSVVEPAPWLSELWSVTTTTSDSAGASWSAKSSPAGTPEARTWPTQTPAWTRSTLPLEARELSSDIFVSAAESNLLWSMHLSSHIHRSKNISTHVPAHRKLHIHLSSILNASDAWSPSTNQTSTWTSTMPTETGWPPYSSIWTWLTTTSFNSSSLTQIGNMTKAITTGDGTIPPVVPPPVQMPPAFPPWFVPPMTPPIPPKGRPSLTCLEKDRTTVTDRYITCFEDLLVSLASVMSSTSTYTPIITTREESCITREETSTNCGISPSTSTATTTSFTTAGKDPACTHVLLDMNHDEGNNLQPPRDSCGRAPLNVSEDEGDNERPRGTCFCAPLLMDDDEGDNSHQNGPSCSRAPLSLDEDEGNYEMPADPSDWWPGDANSTISAPSSTLSESTTAPWDTGVPTGTSCQVCDRQFNDCLQWRCKADGSDADQCAKFCLTSVCYDTTSPDVCKRGTCRPTACPKSAPVNYETADPAGRFTTVISLPSKTTTVIVTPTGSIQPNCPNCDNVFAECVKTSCLQNGSDAEGCAKRCMAYLCYGDHNVPLCKKGFCRPAACPAQTPVDYNTAQPGQPFTTVLSFPSSTITVTLTPTYGEPTLKHGPTPTCDASYETTPNGKWTVLFEHRIHEQPANASFKWDLWDENHCHAGAGMTWNQLLGYNITASIGTPARNTNKMDYELLTNITDSFSRAESEIYFQISKPVGGCKSAIKRDTTLDAPPQGKIDAPLGSDQGLSLNPGMGIGGPAPIISLVPGMLPTPAILVPPTPEGCYTNFKINKREADVSWQIVNDCAQQCGSQKLTANDVSCDSGVNKWQDNGDNPVSVRGGFCTFSMPFSTGNAGFSPSKWDRTSRWTLELVQKMEYETASIEWLLKDPDNNIAAHQIQDLSGPKEHNIMIDVDSDTPEAAKMRYKMQMTITEPRNKDITLLRLTYQNNKNAWCGDECGQGPHTIDTCAVGALTACRPWYQTETPDETKQSLLDYCYDEGNKKKPCFSPMIYSNRDFSCDPVMDKWRPKNAGFERKFSCWWPFDFAVPYGLYDRPPNFKGATVDDSPGSFNSFIDTTGPMPDHGGMNGSWRNATWR